MVKQEFEKKVSQLVNLSNVGELLGWDQEVMMPEGGIKARSEQMSTVAMLRHNILVNNELKDILDALEKEDLSEKEKVDYRELKWEYERFKDVPESLVREISSLQAESVEAWREAKEDNDFEKFAPKLERMVELKRKLAEHIDPEAEPYEVLYRDYEPHIDLEHMDNILDRLAEELPVLLQNIKENGSEVETEALDTEVSEENQMELSRDLVTKLGYNWDRGRLDTSTHPFTSGTQFDARITTRFDKDDLDESLSASIHECGHALYQQGLPDDHYGSFLGESREIGFHESQSRLYENHVGKSEEFWNFMLPKLREQTGKFDGVTPEECYRFMSRVKQDNLIRVKADELTYHLHIIVRFEIERKLVNGDIEVRDLPEIWNEKYREYLGLNPETDSEGVLQDIHWAWGNFGYFPTYSLGSVTSAQIFHKLEQEVEVNTAMEQGEFQEIREWLRENIHSEGRKHPTDQFIKEITGEELTADYFLEYIKEKYSELYDLE